MKFDVPCWPGPTLSTLPVASARGAAGGPHITLTLYECGLDTSLFLTVTAAMKTSDPPSWPNEQLPIPHSAWRTGTTRSPWGTDVGLAWLEAVVVAGDDCVVVLVGVTGVVVVVGLTCTVLGEGVGLGSKMITWVENRTPTTMPTIVITGVAIIAI